jgi:hypothetical protein
MRLLGSVAIVVLMAAGTATAQTVRIDATGGPLTLEEDVQAAIDAWQRVAEPALALAQSDDGEEGAIAIRYADTVRLGPDTLALTLQRQTAGSAPEIEIVLDPSGYRRSPATIVHELGTVLGLGASDERTSVMRPAQSSSSPSEPSAEDADALAILRAAVPEDVNRDGSVDFYDLAALAAAFGAQGINLPADVDGNGRVEQADVDALREAYRFTPPSRTSPGEPAPQPAPDDLPELDPPPGTGSDEGEPPSPDSTVPDLGGESDDNDPDGSVDPAEGEPADGGAGETANPDGGEGADGEP